MAEIPTRPENGPYVIVSALGDGSPEKSATSVDGLLSVPTQVVQLGLQNRVWDLEKKDDFIYQFSVQNVYRYTGMEDLKVIATTKEEKNQLWHLSYTDAKACTIQLVWRGQVGPQLVWTVASEAPDSEIVLKEIQYLPTEPEVIVPSQLFRFIPVLK